MRNLPEDVSGMALYSDDNFIVAHNDSVKFKLRSDTNDGQGDNIPVNKWARLAYKTVIWHQHSVIVIKLRELGLQRMSVVIKQHIHKPYSGR